MKRSIWTLLSLAVAACAPVGCNSQPYMTEERLERGLVILLTGIEGRSPLNEAICRGLGEAGVNYAIKLEDWTSPVGPLLNLRMEMRNRDKAEKIARRITLYQWEHPGRPVFVVGQSGGGAMAVWVAEGMPSGQKVDGVILLAPALAPDYLLDMSLKRVDRGMVNFYSARDWMLLGIGTTVYGTMDGSHTSSAGRVGFDVPRAGSYRPITFEKLLQIPWTEQMSRSGHTGGHLSTGSASFIAQYVVPFLETERWDRDLVKRVVRGEYRALSRPTTSPARHPSSAPATRPSAPPATLPTTRPALQVVPRPAEPKPFPAPL